MRKPDADFAFRPRNDLSLPRIPDLLNRVGKGSGRGDIDGLSDRAAIQGFATTMVNERSPAKAPLQPIDPNEDGQARASSQGTKPVAAGGEDPLLSRFNALRVSSGSQSKPPTAAAPRVQRSESPDFVELFANAVKDKIHDVLNHGHGHGSGSGKTAVGRPAPVMSSLKQKAANIFLPQKTRPEHHRDTQKLVVAPKAPVYADTKPTPMQMFSSLMPDSKPGGFADVEFYTDPDKAQTDLKDLLEGGVDEKDEVVVKDVVDDGSREGLKVKLLPHQVEGVEWMRGRELGPVKKGKVPKGGILADDMGLGKTLQTVALILSQQMPSKEDPAWKKPFEKVEKTTLVVAPLALIRQWEAELNDKVTKSHRLKVLVHHGPQRTRNFKDLALYDIVITTYQILVSEFGHTEEKAGGVKAGCFGLHWWRVVLDEAHTIKNPNAKSTKACYALRSEYRWCLTGTPMQNNLSELQSLIRFLRISPYDNPREWKTQIENPIKNGQGHVAIKKLHSLLPCFMKRRKKDILKEAGALNPGGKPSAEGEVSTTGFRVTERKVVAIKSKFSPAERRFYDRLEARTDKSIERMMSGNVSYASALVLLLRLRQVCNHPKLVEGKLDKDKDAMSTDNSQKNADDDMDSVADMFAGMGITTRNCDICGMILDGVDKELGRDQCQDCYKDLAYFSQESAKRKKPKSKPKVEKVIEKVAISVEKPKRASRNRNTVVDSDDEDVATAAKSKLARKPRHRNAVIDSDDEDEGSWLVGEDQRGATRLGKCGGEEDENAEGGGDWIGDEDSKHDSEDEDDDSQLGSFVVDDEGSKVDPASQESYESDDTFPSLGAITSRVIAKKNVSSQDQSESGSESGSDDYETASEDDDSGISQAELSLDEEYYRSFGKKGSGPPPLLASAKIRELMRILHGEAREHKFIVFSQFTSMLNLVEPFLRKEGFKFARYDGGMRNDEREASLNRLRNDAGTRILLCSLKCGSLGLNLTAATRVVIVEPFWNPFVEEQAIDRVHRLTQTVDVVVYKLTIEDTVEERILALQERKRLLAEQTIEGGMKKNAFKLGMKEILELFRHGGMVGPSAAGEEDDVGHAMSSMAGMRRKGRPESALYGRRW